LGVFSVNRSFIWRATKPDVTQCGISLEAHVRSGGFHMLANQRAWRGALESSWNVDSDSTIGRNFPLRIHELRAVYFRLFALAKMCGSVTRCCSACIYYRNPYSNQQTWKNMKSSWFFEEISSQTSLQTLFVIRNVVKWQFAWKIFSSNFQLLFWTLFLLNFVEKSNDFHRFSLYYHAVFAHNQQDCFKKPWNFQWNWAKNMVQNRSWNFDENIFHANCHLTTFLTSKSVCGDVRDDISSKNHENSMLFHVCWLL